MNTKQLFRKTLLLLWCICITAFGIAQKSINIATTPVPFLRISPDARAGGMGDAGIATVPNASSLFWNPGKTVWNENVGGAAVSYIPWLRKLSNDTYFLSAAGFYKPADDQALALGIRYFSLGNIPFTSDGRNQLGSTRPREMSIDLSYSRKLSAKLGLGITAKYIHSAIVSNVAASGYNYQNASAVAADIGLLYDTRNEGNGFMFGAALSNLGSKVSYIKDASEKDFLPANLDIGASWNKTINEVHALTIALDANKLLVPVLKGDSPEEISAYRRKGVVESWGNALSDFPGQAGVSAGIEYWYDQRFAFRSGYYFEDRQRGGRQYFTAGIGARYQSIGFNFSYLIPSGSGISQNPLSNTLRFSLLFHWGNDDY